MGRLAMLVSSGRVFLGLVVMARSMHVSGLVMVVRGGVMMRGGVQMTLVVRVPLIGVGWFGCCGHFDELPIDYIGPIQRGSGLAP